MEDCVTKELYSEKLKVLTDLLEPKIDLHGEVKGEDEDESLWCDSDEDLNGKGSDLHREWEKRRQGFHTAGYRDGLLAGKEASAQVGFNVGFKESVLVGYSWGQVRGVTSAFACLPDRLKEKLVETQEKRDQFQCFHESVHSLSTTDALKMYHNELVAKKTVKGDVHANAISSSIDTIKDSSDCTSNNLENYVGKLQSILLKSPAIKLHLTKK